MNDSRKYWSTLYIHGVYNTPERGMGFRTERKRTDVTES